MEKGIATGQLDYDYSPVSVFVSYDGSSRRIYMNVSQEGKAAVDEVMTHSHVCRDPFIYMLG